MQRTGPETHRISEPDLPSAAIDVCGSGMPFLTNDHVRQPSHNVFAGNAQKEGFKLFQSFIGMQAIWQKKIIGRL